MSLPLSLSLSIYVHQNCGFSALIKNFLIHNIVTHKLTIIYENLSDVDTLHHSSFSLVSQTVSSFNIFLPSCLFIQRR